MSTSPTSLPAADQKAPYYPDPRMRWGLWDALLGIIVFFVLVIASAVLIASPLGEGIVKHLDAAGFVAAIVSYAALALVTVRATRTGIGSLREDFGLALKPIDLGIGLGIGVVVKIASMLLTAAVVLGSGRVPGGNLVIAEETLWVLLNAILIAVFVAPVVEELFFRGLVLRAVYNTVARWRGREQPADVPTQFRAVVVSVLVSAASFTLLHLYQSTDVLLLVILGGSTMLLGIVNGVVAVRTGRIGAGIVAHVVFNGSGVLLGLLGRAFGA